MLDHEMLSSGPEGLSKQDAREVALATHHNMGNGTSTKPILSQPSIPLLPRDLPPITTASASSPLEVQEHYIQTSALVTANANVSDALCIIFELAKPHNKHLIDLPKPLSEPTIVSLIQISNLKRLREYIADGGSVIVEAGNFAVTVVWTPPSHTPARRGPTFFDNLIASGFPVFANFLSQIEAAKEKHLYPVADKYWHMSLMARDPRRERVAGAVRAVIEPFVKAAEEEGVSMWLEAGSAKARDVYKYFGFEVKELVLVEGVETWCMMKR